MKKTMIMAAACLFGMTAFAAETAYVQISLIPGSTAAGSTANVASMTLTEDNDYTDGFDQDVDADVMESFANDNSVLLFGVVGTHKCQDVVAANLENLVIGFATNKVDTKYTLSFSDMDGRELALYDKVAGKSVTINATTPNYEFTVAADKVGRVYITDRFVIKAPAVPGICHQNGRLEFTAYTGASVQVVGYDDNTVVAVPATDITLDYQEIDLSKVADGQYLVIVTKADQTEEKLVIKK